MLDIIIDKYCNKNWYIKDIASLLDVPTYKVSLIVKKNNLTRNYMKKDWLEEKHYKQKLKLFEVAEEGYCSVDTISRWMKKYNLPTDNELRYLKLGKKYSLDEDFFENIDTEEKAYWLGFIMADGCINIYQNKPNRKPMKRLKSNYTSYRLSILLAKQDINHLTKFKNSLKYDGVLEEGFTILNNKEYPNVKIRVTSKKLCLDLMKQNVLPRKSSKEIFPINLPQDMYRHFIRGYFDGDGSIYYYKKTFNLLLTIVGGHDFLVNLKQYLVDNGFNTNGQIKNEGNYSTYVIGGNQLGGEVLDYLYKDSNIYLDRKFNTYLTWKKLTER